MEQKINRLFNEKTKRIVVVALDHSITLGPTIGLENISKIVNNIAKGGADAVILHKGVIKHVKNNLDQTSKLKLIMHMSASTYLSNPDYKVLVANVEEAKELGADAVSIHINIGAEKEHEMLKDLGNISKDCYKLNMPLIAMMYPRGRNVTSEYEAKFVKHAARIGAELGGDIVKTNYTGDVDSFKEVVTSCFSPVIVAGGKKKETVKEFLHDIKCALEAGARGVCIGRNIFQAENPENMTKAIVRIVHENKTVEEVMKELKIK